jgi:hypothetical protein
MITIRNNTVNYQNCLILSFMVVSVPMRTGDLYSWVSRRLARVRSRRRCRSGH